MDYQQLLPFERNRYYVGKLLTSADFQSEQAYLNNKHRFINHLVLGAGIVCGLSVYSLDDLSIMVESGVAIDGAGRELTIDKSVVKKLSAIEGFEGLTSERAALCLRYREEAVHPVYSVGAQEQGEEYEFNRIRECWELFLADAATLEEPMEPESEFLTQAVLYQDADYLIQIVIPAVICTGSRVRLLLQVEKLSGEEQELSLDGLIQTPAFLSGNGDHELALHLESVSLRQGERLQREFWLTAQEQAAETTSLLAKSSTVVIRKNGQELHPEEHFLLNLRLTKDSAREVVTREIGRINLESYALTGGGDYIRLADIGLQRTKNAYIIEQVWEDGIKRYIPTISADGLRRRYMAWYQPPVSVESRREQPSAGAAITPVQPAGEPAYATGVCEIALGTRPRKGEIYYSDEIMHGLGKGNVYVQVGFEYLAQDERLDAAAKNVIYGSPQLFAGEKPNICYADTAVKVMNDRGSFVVAAKLLRDTTFVVMQLRWTAIRLPAAGGESGVQELAGRSISAEQPTVVLSTRETHYFNVRFQNMEPCTLCYELTEKDSGEITADGLYTAPAREGVYELRIYCKDSPFISTYAYAIVKKSDSPEE